MAEKSRKKFQPIYDALDANNFARVVKLCDAREMVHNPLAKVRALSLALGRLAQHWLRAAPLRRQSRPSPTNALA